MHKPIFEGSGTAIVTPMKADGSINFDAYEKLIDFQLENGTKAIVAAGTTGEASVLSDDERTELIAITVNAAAGRVPVIAGAGANNTAHAIHLSKLAYEAGADALLHVTPYYNKCTPEGLTRHFNACANAADIPVILYYVPSRTGVDIPMEVYSSLTKTDNIVGIKEASGSVLKTEKILAEFGDRYDIYSGCDDITVPLLCAGAKGVISVLANILPKETEEMCSHILNGDIKSGMAIQLKYLKLIEALFIETNPVPVKAALNLMDFDAGTLRLPLSDMTDKNIEKLTKVMEELNVI